MLWLELSGADTAIRQKSVRGAGISPVVAWEYQVPSESPPSMDAISRKSTLSKGTCNHTEYVSWVVPRVPSMRYKHRALTYVPISDKALLLVGFVTPPIDTSAPLVPMFGK